MSEANCSVPWNNRKGLEKNNNSDRLAQKVQNVAISVSEWEVLEAMGMMKKVIEKVEKIKWKEALSQVIFQCYLFLELYFSACVIHFLFVKEVWFFATESK